MYRRKFIQYTAPAVVLPMLLNGLPIQLMANSPLMKALANSAAGSNRVLIIVQLFGGNDGLNTVIPIDMYPYLSRSNSEGGRSSILIPEQACHKLELNEVQKFNNTLLNPGMLSFKNMFSDEKLAIIQSVGYAKPNFSHFRATDIWLSGSDSDAYETTGWAGRQLHKENPGYNDNPPDYPIAISIGNATSPVFAGPDYQMGISVGNPSSSTGFISGNIDKEPNTFYGYHLDYVRRIISNTNTFNDSVKNAYAAGSNAVAYPNTSLANQLKMVARMVHGGLNTKIFHVGVGGFDTHSSQVDALDQSTGGHMNLWASICDSIAAFQKDITQLSDINGPLENRITGFTFSEFGRTIKSNTTYGTDHGTTGPMFLFGKNINPTVLGSSPEVYDAVTDKVKPDLPLQFDYRSVYGSLLNQWFEIPVADIDQVFEKTFNDGSQLGQDIYDKGFHCNLPIFKPGFSIGNPANNVGLANNPATSMSVTAFPNPVTEELNFSFKGTGEKVHITIYNIKGELIAEPVNAVYAVGEQTIHVDVSTLPAGMLLYRTTIGSR